MYYHFVFKVLGGDQRVEQVFGARALHWFDLSTSTCHIGVEIERFPELVDRGGSRTGANVQKHTDTRVDDGSEGVEKPAVRVEFLCVLFLEAEHDLDRNIVTGSRFDDLHTGINSHLRRVLTGSQRSKQLSILGIDDEEK